MDWKSEWKKLALQLGGRVEHTDRTTDYTYMDQNGDEVFVPVIVFALALRRFAIRAVGVGAPRRQVVVVEVFHYTRSRGTLWGVVLSRVRDYWHAFPIDAVLAALARGRAGVAASVVDHIVGLAARST